MDKIKEIILNKVLNKAAEQGWNKFVKDRGGPYGPSSTYENGFFDGAKWNAGEKSKHFLNLKKQNKALVKIVQDLTLEHEDIKLDDDLEEID